MKRQVAFMLSTIISAIALMYLLRQEPLFMTVALGLTTIAIVKNAHRRQIVHLHPVDVTHLAHLAPIPQNHPNAVGLHQRHPIITPTLSTQALPHHHLTKSSTLLIASSANTLSHFGMHSGMHRRMHPLHITESTSHAGAPAKRQTSPQTSNIAPLPLFRNARHSPPTKTLKSTPSTVLDKAFISQRIHQHHQTSSPPANQSCPSAATAQAALNVHHTAEEPKVDGPDLPPGFPSVTTRENRGRKRHSSESENTAPVAKKSARCCPSIRVNDPRTPPCSGNADVNQRQSLGTRTLPHQSVMAMAVKNEPGDDDLDSDKKKGTALEQRGRKRSAAALEATPASTGEGLHRRPACAVSKPAHSETTCRNTTVRKPSPHPVGSADTNPEAIAASVRPQTSLRKQSLESPPRPLKRAKTENDGPHGNARNGDPASSFANTHERASSCFDNAEAAETAMGNCTVAFMAGSHTATLPKAINTVNHSRAAMPPALKILANAQSVSKRARRNSKRPPAITSHDRMATNTHTSGTPIVTLSESPANDKVLQPAVDRMVIDDINSVNDHTVETNYDTIVQVSNDILDGCTTPPSRARTPSCGTPSSYGEQPSLSPSPMSFSSAGRAPPTLALL